MTSATTTIPFSSVKFIDHMPRVVEVEIRLKKFLKALRLSEEAVYTPEDDVPVKMETQWLSDGSDLLTEEDRDRIRRRAMRYVDCVLGSTGMRHLREEQRAELTTLGRASSKPMPSSRYSRSDGSAADGFRDP